MRSAPRSKTAACGCVSRCQNRATTPARPPPRSICPATPPSRRCLPYQQFGASCTNAASSHPNPTNGPARPGQASSPIADEVTARNFETVRDYVEQASTNRDGRVPTNPGNDRKVMRRVASPLRVGKATEDHYLFGEDSFAYWAGELDRAAHASTPLTVGALQQHIDAITPAWGLRPEARDLVISAWALLRKRAWFNAGAACPPPALGRISPSIELRAEDLPEQRAWDDARSNSSKLFGYTIPRTYLTGANVADFSTQIRTRATEGTSQLS